jgi:hypothetical protein
MGSFVIAEFPWMGPVGLSPFTPLACTQRGYPNAPTWIKFLELFAFFHALGQCYQSPTRPIGTIETDPDHYDLVQRLIAKNWLSAIGY